ncbi:pyridoxamine 5'-phosphate oxidase [Chytriomyces cf. hyalinus JEL632]|nr:pyridoxamine 5'-phosphate oxidase [Chytriomyces cf. hyalinus JEL632]
MNNISRVALNVADMRVAYTAGTLPDSARDTPPLVLFSEWIAAARETEKEANAMTIATASKIGRPSSRIVLLKGVDASGFVFYTNYNSRKSLQLTENPFASLTFYWGERQVRVEGPVEKVSQLESDAYFATRPRESQIGAWVSHDQSSPVDTRAILEDREVQVKKRFEGIDKIDKPPFWGGWRVVPTYIEFWQGRVGRLHDRILYERDAPESEWKTTRLMP